MNVVLISKKTLSVETINKALELGLAPFQNECSFVVESASMYEARKGVVVTLKGEEQTAKMPQFRVIQALIASGTMSKTEDFELDVNIFKGMKFVRNADGESFVAVGEEVEKGKKGKKGKKATA